MRRIRSLFGLDPKDVAHQQFDHMIVDPPSNWHDRKMMRVVGHSVMIVFLTIVTQIGGLAWAIGLFFRQTLIAFTLAYATLTIAAVWTAPIFGRVALNCFDHGSLQVQSPLYCALNRNYVTPDLRDVLFETAEAIDLQFPGTQTLILDASFPFLDGFPMLPHRSHDDGEKVDLAFFYRDETDYRPGMTRSPIGYFAFEQGPTDCQPKWPTLRWDLDFLQPLWPRYTLDEPRNRLLLERLARDPRIGKIFVEPHLVRSLRATHPKIRFQGCQAARHDDHIHIQLD